jgi:ubiquinone/menaquinone biosynthesis C-methylase UbiE
MGVKANLAENETEVVRQRYDRGAWRYDLVVWPMELMAMSRFRRRLFSFVNGRRVLEIGVGTGKNLSLYHSEQHVDAIDFSPRMLARARRKPVPPNVRLLEMDAQDLQYPDRTFDTVVSTCVFCSVPDPVRGLREIRRVLRPDGLAVFLEHVRPGNRWLGAIFDRLDPLVARTGPHINRRTLANIRAAGLDIQHDENLVSDIVKLVVARPSSGAADASAS